jgi:hypothetical protein
LQRTALHLELLHAMVSGYVATKHDDACKHHYA